MRTGTLYNLLFWRICVVPISFGFHAHNRQVKWMSCTEGNTWDSWSLSRFTSTTNRWAKKMRKVLTQTQRLAYENCDMEYYIMLWRLVFAAEQLEKQKQGKMFNHLKLKLWLSSSTGYCTKDDYRILTKPWGFSAQDGQDGSWILSIMPNHQCATPRVTGNKHKYRYSLEHATQNYNWRLMVH